MKKSENESSREMENDDWNEEAWQNWVGFWNLILQEDVKQNPHLYKKRKEVL